MSVTSSPNVQRLPYASEMEEILAGWIVFIEDRLVPEMELNLYERAIYYIILRRTIVAGLTETTLSLANMATASGMSTSTARDSIRSLTAKGAVEHDATRTGFKLRLVSISEALPEQQPELIVPVDIENLDFYSNRNYLTQLLDREQYRCFYCLKNVASDDCDLDHVVPQSSSTDNSYRNIVVTCFICNKTKQTTPAPDFLRGLFRLGRLSEEEFDDRLSSLKMLQKGDLKPLVFNE